MPTTDRKAAAGRRTSRAFLGSPTQAYVAASTSSWARIRLTDAASPAFLGSPTQRYDGEPTAMQTTATAAMVLRRLLLQMLGRASTRNSTDVAKGPAATRSAN